VIKSVPEQTTAGIVQSEFPATAKAPQGSTVTLTVSSAPRTVTVPNVVGDTEVQAVGQLTALGLKVSETTQSTPIATDQDIVLDQDPSPGTMVNPGRLVQLVVGNYSSSTGSSGSSGSSGST
jgi:serine/threonine-protein kinase